MAKTYAERIDELEQKQKQLEARKHQLVARKLQAERKAHLQHLIRAGEIVEAATELDFSDVTLSKLEQVLTAKRKYQSGKEYTLGSHIGSLVLRCDIGALEK